jgi:hypothetical protein
LPKFAANLSMMSNDVPFLERLVAAANAGFAGVEYRFPYLDRRNGRGGCPICGNSLANTATEQIRCLSAAGVRNLMSFGRRNDLKLFTTLQPSVRLDTIFPRKARNPRTRSNSLGNLTNRFEMADLL